MYLRNKCYDWHIFRTYKIPNCTIISIGNIAIGGTGKTPAVEYLVRYLKSSGAKVAILSRGYRRESKNMLTVSNGQKILTTYRKSGDEPFLLAKNLPNVPVVVESDRVKGCLYIQDTFHSEFIVLDDAFQHRKIHRDLDIVLFDSRLTNDDRITIPAGNLRESLKCLSRANVVLLTKVDQVDDTTPVINYLKKYTGAPFFSAIHEPHSIISLSSHEQKSVDFLTGKTVFLFSGIGKPDSFRKTVQKLSAEIKGEKSFIDHHKYNLSDLNKIYREAKNVGAELILTTEKDAIRLMDIYSDESAIYYLKIIFRIVEHLDQFQKILNML